MVGATASARSRVGDVPGPADVEGFLRSRYGEADWYDLVMTMLHRTRWRGSSLAAQILTLLVGGLIVAQAVTLVLTLLLPPEPPARYGLGDIAAALRSAEAGRAGLRRDVVVEAPNLDGRGWLTSDSSRADLARRLGTTPDNVQLSFYTPLPFAGTVALPPPGANDADEVSAVAPAADLQPATLLVWKNAGGAVAPEREDRSSGVAMRDVQVAPSSGIPGGPPGAPGGGFPGGGFPGGFPGRFPGLPGGGMPGARLPGGAGGFPAGRIGAPALPGGGVASPARNGSSTAGPTAGAGGGLPKASLPSAASAGALSQSRSLIGDPAIGARGAVVAAPPGLVMPAAPSVFGTPVRGPALPRSAITPAEVIDQPAPRPSVDRGPSLAPPATAPIVTPQAALPAPAEPTTTAPPAFDGARAPTVVGQGRISLPPAAGFQGAIDRARGLLGLGPSPFVQGDFVAALRRSDGQWVVVQPESPFLTAWQKRVALWFLLSLAIVAPLGWLFAQRLSRPLARFAEAAAQLGRDPAAAIVPLDGPAEIGRAAHAFNLMQTRLRSFVDDRTAMVGAISHDLRTPLTRLRFRVEDIPDEVRDGVLQEVDEMEAMIASVLSFIRDASTPGARERLDLRTLLDDVAEDAAVTGASIPIVASQAATVEVEVMGMRRVLANLLENALKYGDHARIELSLSPQEAIAAIIDDGPGVPDEELEQVFQPFYRTAAARVSAAPGSGLGLAVCRSIARAHGGDVRLCRTDAGFRAEVRVPLVYAEQHAIAA